VIPSHGRGHDMEGDITPLFGSLLHMARLDSTSTLSHIDISRDDGTRH